MPGWAGGHLGSNIYRGYGARVSGITDGTVITGASAINSKSPWTVLCESAQHTFSGMMIQILTSVSSVGTSMLFDIGVGAAGSEKPIIDNLLFDSIPARADFQANYIFNRLNIPQGTRISARYQVGGAAGTATGTTSSMMITAFSDDVMDTLSLGRVIPYGIDLTNSKGIVIDPGGSANTPGAWISNFKLS